MQFGAFKSLDDGQTTTRQRPVINQTTTRQQPINNQPTTRQQPDNNQTTTSQQSDNNQTTTRQQSDNNQTTTSQQLGKGMVSTVICDWPCNTCSSKSRHSSSCFNPSPANSRASSSSHIRREIMEPFGQNSQTLTMVVPSL